MEREKRLFLWGVLLASAPWLFGGILGAVNILKGVSEQKATGLGAVAGGLAEAFITFGLVTTLVFEVSAIVLLARTFSRQHQLRSLSSIVCICMSALMILLVGFFLWSVSVPSSHAY
jgi:biopolymer transport protein ExbB/TolQ